MLVVLPAVLDGMTHISVSATGEVDQTILVRGRFGTLDGRGVFIVKANRVQYQRQLSGWELQTFQEYVSGLGAPVVTPPGVQAYRQTDVINFWHIHNLYDLTRVVPPPVNPNGLGRLAFGMLADTEFEPVP